MEIKIAKGAFERTVSVDTDTLPQASQNAVIAIGFRNLPKAGFEWTRETELTEDGDARETGRVAVTTDLNTLFAAGLTSMLNDAHASVKFGNATGDALDTLWQNCVAMAEKRLAGLVSGVVRAGGGGKRLDDVTRRAREIAERRVAAIARKTGEKLTGSVAAERAKEYFAAKKSMLIDLAAAELRAEEIDAEDDLAEITE